MPASELNRELLAHLVDEFGAAGEVARDHFLGAEALVLGGWDAVLPRSSSHLAFALRAAFSALIETAHVPEAGQWRRTSRAVADAKIRYEAVRGLPGAEAQVALQGLLDRIDDLTQVHEAEAIHQQRLIAILLQRTGVSRETATGLDAVKAFDELMGKLSTAVHAGATVPQAERLWEGCLQIMDQLFLPPHVRSTELEGLAAVTAPQAADVSRALALLTTPQHLQHFLSNVRTAGWVRILADAGRLDPPVGADPWPMWAAVNALRDTQAVELAAVLTAMAEEWRADAARSWYVSRAALDLGVPGREIVLEAARRHRSNGAMSLFAIDAALASQPSDEFLTRVADVVLNPADLRAHSPHLDDFLEALAVGIDDTNWDDRVRLLCQKLRRVPEDDMDRRMLEYERASLNAEREFRDDEPFGALLGALTRCLATAWKHTHLTAMLSVLEELPPDLLGPVRAWLLSEAPDVPRDVLGQEVFKAVNERSPNGDDLRLVARLTALGPVSDYVPQWADALGPAPDAGAVARGLAERKLDPAWSRAREWSAVLPGEALAAWTTALAVLAGAYGPASPERFRRMSTGAAWGRSPIELDELQALPVHEAAARVAAWRPEGAEWLVSARELGRVVQAAVTANAREWASSPVEVAAALQHPTYIAHYLRGLASAEALSEANLVGVMEVIELVHAEPWEAVSLGRQDGFEYDADWSEAQRAGIAVIKAAASAELSLEGKTEFAWQFVLKACLDPTPSGIGFGDDDGDLAGRALERAINRPATQALEALVALMGQEFREHGTIRAEGLAELDRVLLLAGADGAEHRAVLASRIGFLRYIAEAWTEERMETLYGEAAPDGLGEVTLLLTLRWSNPSRWFLERFALRVARAGASGNDRALEHAVIGMLWGVDGLAPDTLVSLLVAANRLSAAGEDVGRLLRHGDPDPEFVQRGREFWEAALASGSPNLLGFGWMSEVANLTDEDWLSLTLRTLRATSGALDWSQEVAERVSRCGPSPQALEILNLLLRGQSDPWHRRTVGEAAVRARAAAVDLKDTPEYRRLDSALRERGLL